MTLSDRIEAAGADAQAAAFRARILTLAGAWIGTPYRHQAASRGIGCDCLGLIRGLWAELYGSAAETPAPYGPDATRTDTRDRLAEAALRHFGEAIPAAVMQPGDVLLFRFRADRPVNHLGLLTGPDHFLHAYEQGAVTVSPLVPAWRRRIAAVHVFPLPATEEAKG